MVGPRPRRPAAAGVGPPPNADRIRGSAADADAGGRPGSPIGRWVKSRRPGASAVTRSRDAAVPRGGAGPDRLAAPQARGAPPRATAETRSGQREEEGPPRSRTPAVELGEACELQQTTPWFTATRWGASTRTWRTSPAAGSGPDQRSPQPFSEIEVVVMR